MKKNILLAAVIVIFSACSPHSSDRMTPSDSTNTVVIPGDTSNAGLTGTTDANGFIPADSNKSISGANLKSASPSADSAKSKTDSTK